MAPLGGAHERAAHDDSFAARRDVRELLFDGALVDGAVALEDALALRGATLHDSDVAARRRRPHFRLLVPTGRGYDGVLVRVIDCIRRQSLRKAECVIGKETRGTQDPSMEPSSTPPDDRKTTPNAIAG